MSVRNPVGGVVDTLRSGQRVAHLAKKWGLQVAIAIVLPGGFVVLALLWWRDRQSTLRARTESAA